LIEKSIVAGIEPKDLWDLSLRELILALRSRRQRESERWNHTATLLALQANINAPKGKRFQPKDFHPFSDEISESSSVKKDAEWLYEKYKKFNG
jgi:hypothetical protein